MWPISPHLKHLGFEELDDEEDDDELCHLVDSATTVDGVCLTIAELTLVDVFLFFGLRLHSAVVCEFELRT